jgi:hypothetical protein
MGVAAGVAALIGAGAPGTAGGGHDGMRSAGAARGGTLRIGAPAGDGPLDPALTGSPDEATLHYATCGLLYN